MSGPKVFRIATIEEIQAYCRGLLAQLDAAFDAWIGRCGRLGLAISQADMVAARQRREALHAFLQSLDSIALYKQVPAEIAFLEEDIDKRIAAVAERKACERTARRRLASTAATLSAALAESGASIPADLQVALASTRDGVRDGVEAAERALARGFALLAPAAEAGARERELAARLGEGEKTRTLADWLAGQPPSDDPRGSAVDRHIAELEARAGEAAARPYAERAARLAAEPSPGRRQLLADSLLVELAQLATERRERERSLATLTCDLAELEQLSTTADAALIDRARAALRADDGRTAKDLVAAVRAAIDEARSAAAAVSRRKAVLEGLAALGYEVREGLETAWATNGNVVLRSAQRPDYGVKVSGGVDGGPVQARPIGYGQPGARRDTTRDLDAEALWCSDFDALSGRLADARGEISVIIAKPAGQEPIEIVEETAPERQREPGRAAPMRRQQR